ncbi:radical SAM protein [Dehalogenimonas etheniformans]|uniref:Radical SAM protein n=1 Tax=Dehalogenimonas etheniformans TaxID=1536648 RepID=A0A2P5P7R0_9CHLR|nr:radical SAM protein [Dehalogenimonas etheniformans]PPD58331.1 radical SAM protein [Dehalogenimonas etheniformans]QNT77092.1 radical SAM protein [Dehalogenimonas etheniformans]
MVAIKTKVYHVAYAPAISKAYLFHWGCNLKCQGCLCNKEINCMALEENLDVVLRDPKLPKPKSPEQFLLLDELATILKKVPIKEVLFEGQEASIDPSYSDITKALKDEFGCYITLNTNGVKLPDLTNTDEIVMSLKAVTPDVYRAYTEHSNRNVLGNFCKVYQQGKKLRAESVFIPGMIDLDETEKIAAFVAMIDPNIPYRIDAYFESGAENPWRRATPDEMIEAVTVAKKHLVNVTCTQQTESKLEKKDLMYEVIRLY